MEYIKLSDKSIYISDGNYSAKYPRAEEMVDAGIPFITPANFEGDKISLKGMNYITEEKHSVLQKGHIKENDVLITVRGNNGRVMMVTSDFENANINAQLAFIRTDCSKISPKYIYYYFNSNIAKLYISKNETGIALKQFPIKKLKEVTIPLVSKEKQQEVVSILDKINAIIDADKKQLELLDETVKSRFVEMFGDPVLNSKKYDTMELNSLGYFNRGRSKHRPRNDSILLGGPYPLIQTGEIANADTYIYTYEQTYSEEGLKQSKMWPKGTLCITIAANIAKTAILNIDACFPDSIIGLIPNENVTAIFLHNWFKFFQPILEEQAPAAAQKNLNCTTLGKVQVIIPPINEQNKFDNFVELIDKLKFNVQQHLNLMQELLYKKMQEFFGGVEYGI